VKRWPPVIQFEELAARGDSQIHPSSMDHPRSPHSRS
jgi:hypothetical protein